MRAVWLVGIMRNIIEKHQPRSNRVFKVYDIQAGWSLIESVAITARIESEQAADDQAQCRFM